MSKYMDKAQELRSATDKHYNCCHAVVIPFAEDAGLSEELAFKLGSNFGSGMKMGATCGAITGGLMVLGLFDADDGASVGTYYHRLKKNHNGLMNCADLLRINQQQGRAKKPHCDEMVYECVELVEEILREQGKL